MLDNRSLHDKYFDQFVDITKKLDKIRNQDVKHYLPEFKEYFEKKMSKRIIPISDQVVQKKVRIKLSVDQDAHTYILLRMNVDYVVHHVKNILFKNNT